MASEDARRYTYILCVSMSVVGSRKLNSVKIIEENLNKIIFFRERVQCNAETLNT